jgi:predicted transcriptional regulator
MPPRKSNTLTEAELRLMKMLWTRGESAVSDLVAAMPEGETLAYTSVLTTVRILEQKGYVRHRQEGRAFLYSPCVEEQEASRSEIRNMMQRFFGNSRERLLLSLLGDDEIDPEELARLKEAIATAAEVEVEQPTLRGEAAKDGTHGLSDGAPSLSDGTHGLSADRRWAR